MLWICFLQDWILRGSNANLWWCFVASQNNLMNKQFSCLWHGAPWFKGSNMIVCVLLVSNSRGCCLAAPGDHEGAARVIAPRRDNCAPDRRHLLPVATAKLIMRCVLKAEFQMHTSLSNENGKFYTTMIYPCFSRSVCLSMGSPAWWRFGLCSSGSSLVSRWRDAPLVHARISNVTLQM